jgi:LL-diaminopimelate aminotransferase
MNASSSASPVAPAIPSSVFAPARIETTIAPSMGNLLRSDRLRALPPFLFDEIDRQKRARIAAGGDVINLGVGDPDKPTPGFVIEALDRGARVAANHQYPAGAGTIKFREAAARFMRERFGVEVDPIKHIVAMWGSKDGIAHLPWAITNPGDVVAVPDPAYPVYQIGAVLAGASVFKMPVSEASGWKPLLEGPSAGGAVMPGNTKLLWINYPSNPTAASADLGFFEQAVRFCGERGIVLASDLAYSELYFDEKDRPSSVWQARNASIDKTHAIEFHSLSKSFNMTGWRIGFAVGHAEVVAALAEVKSNIDSGVFNAIQDAGQAALERWNDPLLAQMRAMYRERRDLVVRGLRAIGCEVDGRDGPTAGLFVWARCPMVDHGSGQRAPMDSMEFSKRALMEADVVTVPGAGFSERSRNYVRISLSRETPRIAEAIDRLMKLRW